MLFESVPASSYLLRAIILAAPCDILEFLSHIAQHDPHYVFNKRLALSWDEESASLDIMGMGIVNKIVGWLLNELVQPQAIL